MLATSLSCSQGTGKCRPGMNFMHSLPSAGSGLGSITLLPSLGSLSALGSLSSLPNGIAPIPDRTNDDVGVCGTIQTVQPKSFAPAPSAKPMTSTSTKDRLAALARKRKEIKAQERKTKDKALPANGTIRKVSPQRKPTNYSKQSKKSKTQPNVAAADACAKKIPVGPWTKQEDALLKQMVQEQGEGQWEAKAAIMGTGRTAKAVHTRWLRAKGNIIDPPRGGIKHEMTSMDVDRQTKIMEESGYLLPVLTGSLAAAFGQSSVP